MEEVYYNLEGYPCSREQLEVEMKAFEKIGEAMATPLPNIGLPIIYGTGGEVGTKCFRDLWESM